MRLPLRDAPPSLTVRVSFRQLAERDAFAQRALSGASTLASEARNRGFDLGIGHDDRERLDRRGAFSPIAFSDGGYVVGGFARGSANAEHLVFREEVDFVPWSQYGWVTWSEHTEVSPLYSAWQLLYVDAAFRETGVDVPLGLISGAFDELAVAIEPIRPLLDRQRELLEDMDAAWRPLTKVLVAAQNVYWPKVCGRTVVTGHPGVEFVAAGDTSEDAEVLRSVVGCSVEELTAAYEFLMERGLDREPQDGLAGIRRLVPREYHLRWGGKVRQARDHFDAAEVLKLWLTDLGSPPPQRPDRWPLDSRQEDRAKLYRDGPGARARGPEHAKAELVALELYPHGPLVIGEGPSEAIIIEWLVIAAGGVGSNAFTFHNLEGVGNVGRLERLYELLESYAAAAFVVIDDEGETSEYLKRATAAGKIDPSNILLSQHSLEEQNFTAEELIVVTRELAANPPDGRAAVELAVSADALVAEYARRRERARTGDTPGMADVLLDLAEEPEHGCARISKTELADALGRYLLGELRGVDSPAARDAVLQRRPIVAFVIDRLMPTILRPRPIS